ncbi:hypothetical protein BFGS084_02685 [Bacteroides fragilis]|nr:hypothetical protein BFGS084_02685 [Bacteroides fragilis]
MDKELFKYWLRIKSFCLRQFGSGEKWELIQFRFVMVLISPQIIQMNTDSLILFSTK